MNPLYASAAMSADTDVDRNRAYASADGLAAPGQHLRGHNPAYATAASSDTYSEWSDTASSPPRSHGYSVPFASDGNNPAFDPA